MKRLYSFLLIILVASTTLFAQNPSWANKAVKSVFSLTTFKQDGSLLATANGFFIGSNGEAVSSFTPFKGAASAVIVDSQGKKYNIDFMLGANDIYDIAKFHVEGIKSTPLSIAPTIADKGTSAWLLPYSIKTPTCKQGSISKSEKFQDIYAYYTIAFKAPENCISCPFMNQNGEVIGVFQPSADSNSNESYAVSARYAKDLSINALSINDVALNSTYIRKDLPDDIKQATVSLYMAQQLDSKKYSDLLEQFINKFPNAQEGYIARGQLEYDQNNFSAAKKDMEYAIKVADKKDDAHYNYAKLIYQKEIYKADKNFNDWNLDLAISEANKAYEINPLPMYKYLSAQILYSQNKYQEAYDSYISLTKTNIKNAEIFFEAAQSKIQLKAPDEEILTLLDSAVNCYTKPYLKEAAPYILARATQLDNMKKYREAVIDYNDYENLLPTELNDNFYYIREQAEVNARLYQQALNDLNKAIEMNGKEPTYYAELANLQLRVNMIDKAMTSAKKCIEIAPKYSSGYLVLGLIQIKKGDKTNGLENLNKAKQLGNDQADALIKKYQ